MPLAPRSQPARIPQVAVLVDTSRSYGRDIVRGIRRYVAEHGPWSLYLEPRDLRSRFPDWLKDWPGDGILSRTVDAVMLRQLKATKLPVIELRTTVLPHSFPFVGMDNRMVGTRVAEHLRNRGFQRFACYLDTAEAFFVERSEYFAQTLRAHGFECSLFKSGGAGTKRLRWDEHQRALSEWLASLEKPVGVFAVNDQLGFWLLDAARRAGIAVPEEVAVVGAENDNMLCDTASPPLSSVRPTRAPSVEARFESIAVTASGLALAPSACCLSTAASALNRTITSPGTGASGLAARVGVAFRGCIEPAAAVAVPEGDAAAGAGGALAPNSSAASVSDSAARVGECIRAV